MKTDIVQKAIVLNEQGQLLALRRSNTDTRRPGQWDFPGGMLNPKEDLIVGIKREIIEETGLQVKDELPVFTRTEVQTWEDGKANVVRIFYLATATTTNVTLSYEHSDYTWMTIERAAKEFEYDRHRQVLRHIIDNHLLP